MISRRQLFRAASLAGAAGVTRTSRVSAAPRPASLATGRTEAQLADLYTSIGVRPLINCRGTLTGKQKGG